MRSGAAYPPPRLAANRFVLCCFDFLFFDVETLVFWTLKWNEKSMKNGPKINQKSIKNGPKIDQKWTKNQSKIVQNSKKTKSRKSQPVKSEPEPEITACEIRKRAGNHSLWNQTKIRKSQPVKSDEISLLFPERKQRENTVKWGRSGVSPWAAVRGSWSGVSVRSQLKISSKWTKHRSKMDQKSIKNRPKWNEKSMKNGPKINQKSIKNGSNID